MRIHACYLQYLRSSAGDRFRSLVSLRSFVCILNVAVILIVSAIPTYLLLIPIVSSTGQLKGDTALMCACKTGQMDAIQWLLDEAKADVKSRNDDWVPILCLDCSSHSTVAASAWKRELMLSLSAAHTVFSVVTFLDGSFLASVPLGSLSPF